MKNYTFVKITTFYKEFLNSYYNAFPAIKNKSYQQQYDHLMSMGYGYVDFFARRFREVGVDAHEIVYNAMPLQRAWAKENGSHVLGHSLLLDQLKKIKPEVILFQDSSLFSAEYLNKIRQEVPSVKQITALVCAPFTSDKYMAFKVYDYLLGCSPQFVRLFRNQGLHCYEFRHAFEAEVINNVPSVNYEDKPYDIAFIGSFKGTGEYHKARIKLFEDILKKGIDINLIGKIDDQSLLYVFFLKMAYIVTQVLKKGVLGNKVFDIPYLNKVAALSSMPEKTRYSKKFRQTIQQKRLYGYPMYEELAKARIGLNIHGGVAGDYAANVRMFEVTGIGSLLLTDQKKDIHELFEPDKEIVTYGSFDECIEKMRWLMEHPHEAKEIAMAGQRKTLQEHTVKKRVLQLDEIIRKHFKS